MNLKELFEMQRVLDDRIIEEKELDGQDLLHEKILALQVELGELANEWRGFKFWSKNREPHKDVYSSCSEDDADHFFCGTCHKTYDNIRANELEYDCIDCNNYLMPMKKRNPMLEEYVDCLHFILSIGLEKGFNLKTLNLSAVEGLKRIDIVSQFNYLFDKVGDFSSITNHNNYMYIVPLFIGLGEMLGFTWEQIEQAYKEKNATNHLRQRNGY